MDPTTLNALQASIRHWTRLATGKYGVRESIYHEDCALCLEFNCKPDDNCEGCPVAERAGMPHCKNTPWLDVHDIFVCYNRSSPKFQAAACVQLAFLKSLLPEYCNPPQPAQLNLPPLL